jgi:hypothetical protein
LASNGVKIWIIGVPATTNPRWLRAIAFFAQNAWAVVAHHTGIRGAEDKIVPGT